MPSVPSAERTRWQRFGRLAIGSAALTMAAVMCLKSAWPALGLSALAPIGFLYLWSGFAHLTSGPRIALLYRAYDLLAQGALDDAEAHLAVAASGRPPRALANAVDMTYALIALRRGRASDAVACATRALDGRLEWSSYARARTVRAEARAVRSLAYAALDEHALARADADAVASDPYAQTSALARAALSEAVRLARSGARDELDARLRRERRLLLEHQAPRERALVRALAAWAADRPARSYRSAAAPQRDARGELPLAQWIGWMVPAAEHFAPGSPRPASGSDTPADERADALARVAPAPLRHATLSIPFAVPVVASVVAAAAGIAWQIATPPPPNVPAPVAAWWPVGVLGVVLLFVAPFAWGPWVARIRTRRELRAARLWVADRAKAERAWRTTTWTDALEAGQAFLALACLAEREARFTEAVALCDQGLAKIASVRSSAADVVLPALLAERALGLAALGRTDEAAQGLARLRAECPEAPNLASHAARVMLVQAVRDGALLRARALATERSANLSLNVRDELLANLVLASAPGAARTERERLRAELDGDDELRAWVDAIAPTLRPALESSYAGPDAAETSAT